MQEVERPLHVAPSQPDSTPDSAYGTSSPTDHELHTFMSAFRVTLDHINQISIQHTRTPIGDKTLD